MRNASLALGSGRGAHSELRSGRDSRNKYDPASQRSPKVQEDSSLECGEVAGQSRAVNSRRNVGEQFVYLAFGTGRQWAQRFCRSNHGRNYSNRGESKRFRKECFSKTSIPRNGSGGRLRRKRRKRFGLGRSQSFTESAQLRGWTEHH